jgi:hypothetical protein
MSSETVTKTAVVARLGHPSVWLVVPTLSLLVGQAVAALPLVIPSQFFFLRLSRCCWLSKQQRDAGDS